MSATVSFLRPAGIIIAKLNGMQVYFYGDGRFIISKVETEEMGILFMQTIINQMEECCNDNQINVF